MNPKIETPEWKLKVFFDWVPKYSSEPCAYCNGSGEIGGGFKSISGAESCPKCHGSRSVLVEPKNLPPKIPDDLVEHMRRAFWDYTNANK